MKAPSFEQQLNRLEEIAAELAREGLTGAKRILEGPQGMAAGMSRDADARKLCDGLGTRWATEETSFKYHASCRHTHPAELYVYLIEGEIVLENEGQPDRMMKAGDVASVAPGRVHQALNRGSVTAKGVAVFVAEKGKPLAAPAP